MSTNHLGALIRLAPAGCWELDEGSNVRLDLSVIAAPLDAVETAEQDLVTESRPQDASALLSRWETLYRLRAGTFTEDQRVDRLVARVQAVPSFTPVALEAAAEAFTGIAMSLYEPHGFRCDSAGSVCDNADDLIDGGLVFVLDIDWDAAVAGGLRRTELQAFIAPLQPAHVVSLIRLNDFHTDDPYSLTDRDLLGA